MIKYTTIILAILTLLSCNEQKDYFIPEKFEIEKSNVTLPFEANEIIQFENGYICNFENYDDSSFHLGFIDKTFKLNNIKTKLLNQDLKLVKSIWTSHDTLFVIDIFTIKFWKNNHWNILKTLPNEDKTNFKSYELNYPIYNDENFSVKSCCLGEFGGAIYFRDKKSGKTYSCEATSVISVNKIHDSYYVTSSLPHGSGFTKVIKIDNPRNLYEIKKKSQLFDCGWYDIYPEDPNNEIKHPIGYDKGFEVLIDTMDIMIIGSFVKNEQLYHVFSDNKNTYLGYFKNKKPVVLYTIINKPSWYGKVRDIQNNSNLFPIKNRYLNGVILREYNKLKLIEFKINALIKK
jgi:hypothetical protein